MSTWEEMRALLWDSYLEGERPPGWPTVEAVGQHVGQAGGEPAMARWAWGGGPVRFEDSELYTWDTGTRTPVPVSQTEEEHVSEPVEAREAIEGRLISKEDVEALGTGEEPDPPSVTTAWDGKTLAVEYDCEWR